MKTSLRAILVTLALACVLLTAPTASAETLTGEVQDRDGVPIPGLTVSLAHPAVGRSVPKVTDLDGRFSFVDVPSHPDSYYLEIYWSDRLVFRRSLGIHGDVRLDAIRLD